MVAEKDAPVPKLRTTRLCNSKNVVASVCNEETTPSALSPEADGWLTDGCQVTVGWLWL